MFFQQIQALIRPPDGETQSVNPKAINKKPHPYYRRPGRGHNRDCCDACEEGGNLICCDRCPSSFHLGCHDPPLNEKDLPAGQWLCHTCRMTQNKPPSKSGSVDQSSIKSEPESRSDSPSNDLEQILSSTVSKKLLNLRKRSSSRMSVSSDTSLKDSVKSLQQQLDVQQKSTGEEPAKKVTPLDELIKAASLMNPKQFELPREMSFYFNFPGTDKSKFFFFDQNF